MKTQRRCSIRMVKAIVYRFFCGSLSCFFSSAIFCSNDLRALTKIVYVMSRSTIGLFKTLGNPLVSVYLIFNLRHSRHSEYLAKNNFFSYFAS